MKEENYTDVMIFIAIVLIVGMVLGFILGQNATMHFAQPIDGNTISFFGRPFYY